MPMKIQAKDCANGGIFQMELARADDGKTAFTHKLAQSAFYYDNREGAPAAMIRNGQDDVFLRNMQTTISLLNMFRKGMAQRISRY